MREGLPGLWSAIVHWDTLGRETSLESVFFLSVYEYWSGLVKFHKQNVCFILPFKWEDGGLFCYFA